eukprot:TRINITY_DN3380_c0_g1_i10.p1 TRINITY_DN3380_c0_g1~~TRINITY_DN3380_c0_g1_i10.p1  ORF type:complete len:332 (+),score=31.05 TRINITY_DN3380_c0_g1_i10:81-1076(+)
MVRRDGGAHGVWHTNATLNFCRCSMCTKTRREEQLDPANAGKTAKQLFHEGKLGYRRGNGNDYQDARFEGSRAELKATAREAEKQAHIGAFEQDMYVARPAAVLAPTSPQQPAGLCLGDFMVKPRPVVVTRSSPRVVARKPTIVSAGAAVPRPVHVQQAAAVWPARQPATVATTIAEARATVLSPPAQAAAAAVAAPVVAPTAPLPLPLARPALTRTLTEPLTPVRIAQQGDVAAPAAVAAGGGSSASRPTLARTLTSPSPGGVQTGQPVRLTRDLSSPVSGYIMVSSPVVAGSPTAFAASPVAAQQRTAGQQPELVRATTSAADGWLLLS